MQWVDIARQGVAPKHGAHRDLVTARALWRSKAMDRASMLNSLGKWLHPGDSMGGLALRQLCTARHWALKRPRDNEGLVIEPPPPAPWRVEWGPSQRSYIPGFELRLRAFAGFDPDTYGVLMPAGLMNELEHSVYARSTEGVKTQLDDDLPEEMRWLAMSPRLSRRQMGELHGPFAAVGNGPGWMGDWLAGPMVSRLLMFSGVPRGYHDMWPDIPPMALIVKRGELIWRVAVPQLDATRLLDAIDVFAQAWEQAVPFAVVESRPQALY